MSNILRRSTEIITHKDGQVQRVTKVVFKQPIIRWYGRRIPKSWDLFRPEYRTWCKTRHVTISTVVIGHYIETMAFPGHVSLFSHHSGRGFGLDIDRIYPTRDDLRDFNPVARKVIAQEERMIRRLSKGVRRSWSH